MTRGRNSVPTPLPEGFQSWQELYEEWEKFRTSTRRTTHPGRAARFAEKYGIPEWIIGTVPYVFRQAKRQDAIGEYAREAVRLVEEGKLGLPKANNEIRAFAQQNPMFREPETQRKALAEALKRLRELTPLTSSIRNLSNDLTSTELEMYHKAMAVEMRKIQQLKNRIALALKERKERS